MRIIKKIFFWFVGAFIGFVGSVIAMTAAGVDGKTGGPYALLIALALAFYLAWKYPKQKPEGANVLSKTPTEKVSPSVDLSPIEKACEGITDSDPEMVVPQLMSKFNGAELKEGLRQYLPIAYRKVVLHIQSSDSDPMDVAEEGMKKIHTFMEPASISEASFPNEMDTIRRAIARAYISREEAPRRDYVELFGDLPFILQKSECLYYAANRVKIYTTKTETTYKAGSRGVSVRLAKGLSYRIGNAKGKRVQEEYEDFAGRGTVAVTSKHIYYFVDDRSTRIPLQKLVSASVYGKRVEFVKEAAQPKPTAFEFDCSEDADIFIRAIKNGG